MPWATEGVKSNPATDTILADTGALEENNRRFTLVVSSTVNVVVVFEYRNAANDANVKSHIFPVAANQPLRISTEGLELLMAADERLRLRVNAGVSGSVQGSIFHN